MSHTKRSHRYGNAFICGRYSIVLVCCLRQALFNALCLIWPVDLRSFMRFHMLLDQFNIYSDGVLHCSLSHLTNTQKQSDCVVFFRVQLLILHRNEPVSFALFFFLFQFEYGGEYVFLYVVNANGIDVVGFFFRIVVNVPDQILFQLIC